MQHNTDKYCAILSLSQSIGSNPARYAPDVPLNLNEQDAAAGGSKQLLVLQWQERSQGVGQREETQTSMNDSGIATSEILEGLKRLEVQGQAPPNYES